MLLFEHNPLVSELYELHGEYNRVPDSQTALTFGVLSPVQRINLPVLVKAGYQAVGRFHNRYPMHAGSTYKLTLVVRTSASAQPLMQRYFDTPYWQRYVSLYDKKQAALYKPWRSWGVNGGCGFMFCADPNADVLKVDGGMLWQLPALLPAAHQVKLRAAGWERIFDAHGASWWTNVTGGDDGDDDE
jgi:hypothetical protein